MFNYLVYIRFDYVLFEIFNVMIREFSHTCLFLDSIALTMRGTFVVSDHKVTCRLPKAPPRRSHFVATRDCLSLSYSNAKDMFFQRFVGYLGTKIIVSFHLSNGFNIFLHHPSPLEVAEDGDNDIQPIERGFKRNVFVEIQTTGDYIHDNPHKPLFQILTRQSQQPTSKRWPCTPRGYKPSRGQWSLCRANGR